MLQASASPQVAPMPSPPPPPPEDCQADRQLKAILYSGTRALKRESSSKPASLHDMLEGTHRDRSPTRKKAGIVLRGTYSTFEIDSTTVMGTPSGLSQVAKIRNTSTPDAVHRVICVCSPYLYYVIKPDPRAASQGGKIRVINQINETRALLSGHAGAIIDVSVCPWDPSLVLSISSDGVAILWRIGGDEKSGTLSSPDGSSTAGDISSRQICSIKSNREAFKASDWHPTLPCIALARGPSVEIWDLSDVVSPEDGEESDDDTTPSVPPTFTNNPADPRVFCLQGHREAVNTICFSPDGTQLSSGGDDGAVCIWMWRRPEPLIRTFSPDDDRSINSLKWYTVNIDGSCWSAYLGVRVRTPGFSSPSCDRLLYIQCDSHRNIQIWDVEGDSPCGRLDFSPGKNKLLFQAMTVDPSASHVVVPFNGDDQFGFIIVHVLRRPLPESATSKSTDRPDEDAQSNLSIASSQSGEDAQSEKLDLVLPPLDPAGCRFDHLCPFSVQHLVLGMCAISDEPGDGLRLYAAQSHAIQVFHVTGQQLSPSEQPSVFVSSEPRTSLVATQIPSPLSEAPLSSPREPPPPPVPASPMGSFTPSSAAKRAPKHLAVPSPTAILKRSQSGGSLASRVQAEPRHIRTVPDDEIAAGTDAAVSVGDLDALMAKHFEAFRSELESDRKAREREEIHRTKKLLESVSKTINHVIPERVDAVVKAEFRDKLVPELTQFIMRTVSAAVESSVIPVLERVVAGAVHSLATELPQALRQPIHEGFRESFKDQLLPAFRASFSTMFHQINATLEAGMRQQRESSTLVSNESVESILNLLNDVRDRLAERRGLDASSPPAPDLKVTLSSLVEQNRLDEAFTKALNAGDSALVLWLCSLLSPSCLHQRGPHEFSPPVLLSLAQQVSFHLSDPATTTDQLEWLREALLALSSRPRNEQIASHIPGVLGQIADNVESQSGAFDTIQQGICRMITFLISTLINMPTQ
ncbi:hypothetical protein PBRA_005876 [Plasmodiophora brassicae]|uniref:Enhancer of mRNA-decapping protein 4 C-terminal domain-containing protein n=1 Tax=Plasmodiophora brassicae TaxID=37360 RepID=A0A0G4IRE3_PLABS|nr:hypothetical protein PBRA_005876 [Plasmodiophora brassicae]